MTEVIVRGVGLSPRRTVAVDPRAHSQRRSTVQAARLRPRDTCHRIPPTFASPRGSVFVPPRTSHKHGALSPCCPDAPKADAFQVVSRTPRAAEHQPQSIERPHRRPGTPPPGLRTTTPKAPVHRPRAANDHPEGSGSPPSGLRMTTPKAPVHQPRASNNHPEGFGSPPPEHRMTTPKAPIHHPQGSPLQGAGT